MPLAWAPVAAEPVSYFAVADPNLVLDTVKRAEDSDALVLRLYEAHGARGTALLEVGLPFAAAVLSNTLEEEGCPLETRGRTVVLPYRPHQLMTVLLR
jgi:alpha-mannosidase